MKTLSIIIIVIALIIGSAILLSSGGRNASPSQSANNVSIVEGVQIIEITAKGGYLPKKSVAQAGIPTIIRFNTKGTFDCSSALRIPSMNITKNLPPSGITDVDIGSQPISLLKGTCGMGMYPFEIDFRL